MADDGYVTIHRTTDAAQGELLAETLRSAGIDARFHRVSSTLIGIPTLLIEMTVDVPAKLEAQALEVLRDLEYVGADDAAQPDGREEPGEKAEGAEDEEGEARPSAWRAVARAGFTLFLPGTCHLYAGRPWTALVLGTGASAYVGLMIAATRSSIFEAALTAVLAIVAGDMIGGVRAARADALGRKADRRRQITSGFLVLAVASLFGVVARTAMAVPRMWRGHLVSRFSVTCTRSSLVLESRDDDDRNVTMRWAAITTPRTAGSDLGYDVPFSGSPVFRLRAGTTERVSLKPHPDVLASCRDARECRMVFAGTIEAADGQGPRPLHVSGACTPGWGEDGAVAAGVLTLAESDGDDDGE